MSRRKQLLGLSSKVANMKLLQLLLETHSAWHSSSDSRSKTAPTMFEIGSREQRSPLWKRSHRAASDSHEELVRRWRKSSFLTNMTWCCALFCTLRMLGLLIFSFTSQSGSSGWLVGLFPSVPKIEPFLGPPVCGQDSTISGSRCCPSDTVFFKLNQYVSRNSETAAGILNLLMSLHVQCVTTRHNYDNTKLIWLEW